MMTVENKDVLDALLASHEVASCLLDPTTCDAAMLATVVQMVRDGEDEMVLYVLRNIKPHALELAKDGEKKGKPEIDIGELLNDLFN